MVKNAVMRALPHARHIFVYRDARKASRVG